MSSMYSYILFDLDGTLTDPKEGICGSVRHALERSGIEPPEIDALTPFIGPPLKDSFMEFYSMDSDAADAAVAYYRERFSVTGWKENEVYPGMESLLKELASSGVSLALASSKPTVFVEKILKHFRLYKYFKVIVGSGLDGSLGTKQEVVDEALKQLYGHVPAKDDPALLKTAMVGDRRFDMEAAAKAGIDGIAVSYGYAPPGELAACGADAIAGSVLELRELLLGGEDPELWRIKQDRLAAEEQLNIPPLPENSFLRAIYMITPFAVFWLLYQGLLSLGVSLIDHLKGSSSETDAFIRSNSSVISLALYISVRALTIMILWLIFSKRDVLHFLPFCKKKRLPLKLASCCAAGIVASFVLNHLLTLAAGLILPLIYDADKVAAFFESATYNHDIPLAGGLLLYCLLAPLMEELCFRWLLLGRMERVFGEKIALFLSALFFGIYHGNLIQGIYAFICGLIMGRLMQKEKGLSAPLAFHISANTFIFLISRLS